MSYEGIMKEITDTEEVAELKLAYTYSPSVRPGRNNEKPQSGQPALERDSKQVQISLCLEFRHEGTALCED
jgi:hypothetical protein